MVVERLERALSKRSPLIEKLKTQQTDCYRFFDGSGDGMAGFVIEVFSKIAFFQFHRGKCELGVAEMKIAARWCIDHLGVESVYLKTFLPDRSAEQTAQEMLSPEPFSGVASASSIEAKENGNTFLIRPYAGASVGLFLDQRDNRKRLAQAVAKQSRVLNLFSYTCGFSVYAARAGAVVTSVDVSAKYLEWAKENFAANGLLASDHRFFVADARFFLRAAVKRHEQYDLIILDPPSFARGKNNEPFSVKRDLGSVLDQCIQVLAPGGSLFVSTNLSVWGGDELEAVIEKSLGPVRYKDLPDEPKDFKTQSITYRWLER